MTYAEVLLQKGKRGAAAFVQAECNSAAQEPSRSPQHLNALLDVLLHPEKNIDDQDTIDWCKCLIGGGRSYEEFASSIRAYDNTAMCGLVWTSDFVAYRCRTCGISQCMSLCADCFKDGNHEGHDYNMFKSQAGGACDCGDSSVMRESGFCSQHHGSNMPYRATPAPPDLICVAENMIPRIILRLIQHLRINFVPSNERLDAVALLEKYEEIIGNADRFLRLLNDFSCLGAAMRSVITRCLVDSESYSRLTYVNEESEKDSFMRRSKWLYEDALDSLHDPEPPKEFKDCVSLMSQLKHNTFMEELVFWTVIYEFPEELVCLLLKLLPDAEYKEAFTRSFVTHYSRVSVMLARSSNSDKLSSRIVHVSVQLFSNKSLALAMTEQLSLLHIMVCSLKNMMRDILIDWEANESQRKRHRVVDCSTHVMKDHCYWPLMSDLNNVLSHPPIAFRFMADNALLAMWFDFLKMFQGMNLNIRAYDQHVEFEPNTYCASFSGELEACATPMWALVPHLEDASTREYTANVIRHCLTAIREWMSDIGFESASQIHPDKASFHIPLHRYFAIFLHQAIKYQGFNLKDLLPDPDTLKLLAMHPLRVQTAFYEIVSGLWVRNGLQMKGQVVTYVQSHFCKSMVDADMFLLQIVATQLPPNEFLQTVLERFQIMDWLSLAPCPPLWSSSRIYRDHEQELQMIGSCLIFLVSLLSLRTNLGMDEESLARLEMVSLLCVADKTHSVLHEHMPEKPGAPVQQELFDRVLSDIAFFAEPRFEASGNMQQGMYYPKPIVWEKLYDPIYVLLRSVHGREFQTSIERFSNFAKARYENDPNRSKSVMCPWPPWRLPFNCDEEFEDPRRLLHSRYAHGLIFNILYKAVKGSLVNDFITSLAVHLLELAITFPQTDYSGKEVAVSKPWLMIHEPVDLKFDSWFPTDWLSANLRHTVSAIFSQPFGSASSNHEAEAGSVSRLARTESGSSDALRPDGAVSTMELDLSDDDANSRASYQNEPHIHGAAVEGREHQPLASLSMGLQDVDSHHNAGAAIRYNQPLALTGPHYTGSTELVLSRSLQPLSPSSYHHLSLAPSTSRSALTSEASSSSSPPSSSVSLVACPRGRHNAPAAAATPPRGLDQRGSVITVNESIISLMLRLHSKYSGKPDSYVPIFKRSGHSVEKEYRESRIGDACFFIEKVLDLICQMDDSCAEFVSKSRKILWPHYHEMEAKRDEERERLEAKVKKRKAKERQKQLMEQMAQQRQRFMEGHAMEPDTFEDIEYEDGMEKSKECMPPDTEMDETPPLPQTPKQTEYTCCFCLSQGPASEERPIGLIALIQSSSVLAHKHKSTEHLVLATSEEEVQCLPSASHHSLGQQYDHYLAELMRSFDQRSALISSHIGWKGGLHIQSCRHHMHYECRDSYCDSIRQLKVPREQALDSENGEFFCPLCRQMANTLLPVLPDPNDVHGPLVSKGKEAASNEDMAQSVQLLLGKETLPISSGAQSRLHSELSRVLDIFSEATLPQYRMEVNANIVSTITLSLSSIARANLEMDLVQRGGSFVQECRGAAAAASFMSVASTSTNKPKYCFVPLMRILALHMKVAAPRQELLNLWASVSGLWTRTGPGFRACLKEKKVPLLLQESLVVMIHTLLYLPVNIDITIFNTVIQACYNLQLTQTIMYLVSRMQTAELESLVAFGRAHEGAEHPQDSTVRLLVFMAKIVEYLRLSSEHVSNSMDEGVSPQLSATDLAKYEEHVSLNLLPFLRIASLLRHYMFHQDLPYIDQDLMEFSELLRFLELAPAKAGGGGKSFAGLLPDDECSMSCDGYSSVTPKWQVQPLQAVRWFTPDGEGEIKLWFHTLIRSQFHPDLLKNFNQVWKQPQLLKLPKSYDQIFQFYHKRECNNCFCVPKDPIICLICGAMVCLKEPCCRQNGGPCETVKHCWDCGGGTGVFLPVNSSTILVIRGRKACVWGSVYLDSFGEEDKDLKRGKPLFLHPDRYQLLEHQWLTHKFDHISRKWVRHRDAI